MRWIVAVLAMSTPAWAQNSVQGRDRGDEQENVRSTELDRPVTLRVLRDPYEIASFYRADGSGPAAARYENEDGTFTIDPRSISSFYRSSNGGAYDYTPFRWHYRSYSRAGRWPRY